MKIDQNQKEEVTFRNHFSSVFEKIWSWILVLAAIIVANISSVADGMDMIANKDAFGQLLAGFGGIDTFSDRHSSVEYPALVEDDIDDQRRYTYL